MRRGQGGADDESREMSTVGLVLPQILEKLPSKQNFW